jgi:hypothetical protein
MKYLDLCIHGALLIIELAVIIWVHLQVMEAKFLLNSFLEGQSLFKSQRI